MANLAALPWLAAAERATPGSAVTMTRMTTPAQSPDETALLSAMRAADSDDTRAHRVYADWLAERGRDEEATRIRRGCDLVDAHPFGLEMIDLFSDAGANLPGPEHWLPGGPEEVWLYSQFLIRRGLLEEVAIGVDLLNMTWEGGVLPSILPSVLARAPLARSVHLYELRYWTAVPDGLIAQAASFPIANLSARLDSSEANIQALGEAATLQELELWVDNEGLPIQGLAKTRLADQLVAFSTDGPLTEAEGTALSRYTNLRRLTCNGRLAGCQSLKVDGSQLETLSVSWGRDLGGLPTMSNLRCLFLRQAAAPPRHELAAFMAGLPELRKLHLRLGALPSGGLRDLDRLEHLEFLALTGDDRREGELTSQQLSDIASAAPQLKHLSLQADLVGLDLAPLAELRNLSTTLRHFGCWIL